MADDLYEARNSIYCYPNTDVLINKLNIKDNQLLSEVERKIVLAKSYELRKNSKIGSFDLNHFIEIHKFLFEDIYPFAGKFRNENIAKGYFSFAEWQYIEPEIKAFFNGYVLDLQNTTSEELLKASVDSIADTKELEETLNRCLIKTDF